MTLQDDRQSELERQAHAALRSLPLRRAPDGLAAGVLEAIARRAALPWWRRSVMQWPAAARLLFALVAGALVLLSLQGRASMSELAAPAGPALTWTQHLLLALGTVPRLLSALVGALVGAVPVVWLQASLVVAVMAYLFLFGVGTAAYRLLYLER